MRWFDYIMYILRMKMLMKMGDHDKSKQIEKEPKEYSKNPEESWDDWIMLSDFSNKIMKKNFSLIC